MGVPVSNLDLQGNLIAQVLPRRPPQAASLKLAQIATCANPEVRLRGARAIIGSKVAAQRHLAEGWERDFGVSADPVRRAIFAMRAESSSSLRVSEARVALSYFGAMREVLSRWGVAWEGRTNARDSNNLNAAEPVNAALNYAYSLTEALARVAVHGAGLLSEFGLLHEPGPSKEPLVYDVEEPLRWLAESAVLGALSERVRAKGKGRWRAGLGGFDVKERYRLSPAFARSLVDKFNEALLLRVRFGGRRMVRAGLLPGLLVAELARWMGERGGEPRLSFSIEEGSRDGVLTREEVERILAMSPFERREAGIRANTFHYLKRRAALGVAPVRLYRKVRTKLTAG
jgi:CRISPR-associated endonuclease Cas1